MKHIGAKVNGSAKINSRRANQRWFVIEYPVDVDYNQEAYASETKDIREHLPTDGWYSFQTNSGAEARQHWFITGAMKIVGAVSEQDVRSYARGHGFEEDLPWLEGKAYSEDDAIDLAEYMRTTGAMPTPSKTEMRERIEAERGKVQFSKEDRTPIRLKQEDLADYIRAGTNTHAKNDKARIVASGASPILGETARRTEAGRSAPSARPNWRRHTLPTSWRRPGKRCRKPKSREGLTKTEARCMFILLNKGVHPDSHTRMGAFLFFP